MGDALAAIVAAYRTTRRKDWRVLRQVPLVHGIEALTRAGTPFALAADEAKTVREAAETFVRRFPREYDQIRLCGLDYGLNAIIGALGTAEHGPQPPTPLRGAGLPLPECERGKARDGRR